MNSKWPKNWESNIYPIWSNVNSRNSSSNNYLDFLQKILNTVIYLCWYELKQSEEVYHKKKNTAGGIWLTCRGLYNQDNQWFQAEHQVCEEYVIIHGGYCLVARVCWDNMITVSCVKLPDMSFLLQLRPAVQRGRSFGMALLSF